MDVDKLIEFANTPAGQSLAGAAGAAVLFLVHKHGKHFGVTPKQVNKTIEAYNEAKRTYRSVVPEELSKQVNRQLRSAIWKKLGKK